MQLKKINRIQNFGIYEDFAWSADLSDFNSFNAIYGWNYSGKTTLSRVFRCFEMGSFHPDYTGCNFEIEYKDGTKYKPDQFPSPLPIRVFNSDFINENLKWNTGIEPIFLLGQDNIDLQAQLDTLRGDLEALNQNIYSKEQQKNSTEQALSTAVSDRARELKYEYSIPVFDKRHFEPLLIEAKAKPGTDRSILTPEAAAALTTTYLSTDKKDQLDPFAITLPDIITANNEANVLLQQTVTSKVIERLKTDIQLNEWVKQGKEIHIGKNDCEFCGNPLPEDLLNNLNSHFSEDYEKLINGLTTKAKQLEGIKLNVILPETAKFYGEFQQSFTDQKNALEKETAQFNDVIVSIIQSLEHKKLKVFDILPEETIVDNTTVISTHALAIDELITKHNTKTKQFTQQKEDAYKKLIENAALNFIIVHNYEQALQDIQNIADDISAQRIQLRELLQEIKNIEQQLSETVKGAETTNSYLKRYFGKDDVQISVTSDNKFQLLRDGRIAKNLSEGEKTAIAFAYFITRLQDKNTTFANTIVYIDDPISSLDSNHLFNTYAFIRDYFYEYIPTGKQHKCKCAQFFISTHNYEFFNLIKDWFDKMKKTDASYYLVTRITNTTTDVAALKPLHNHLLKFKSEYSYLFSVIANFKQNPVPDFDQLYNLPNILRRFIESFTAFKYLSTRNIEENIERLITNSVDCERVRKFVHYHTHSLSTSKLEQFSDLTECIAVIGIVTDALEIADPVHYASLMTENAPPVAVAAV